MQFKIGMTGFLAAVFVVWVSAPVLAQDEEANWDKYSVLTEKVLMLTGDIKSSVPDADLQALYLKMEVGRFNMSVKGAEPNSADVTAWCEKAVKDTQFLREATDEYGQAEVTLKAKMERCSQVFRHALTVGHKCEIKRTKPKKGKPRVYAECKVQGELAFTKFKGDQSTGQFRYQVDTGFGAKGTYRLKSEGVAQTTISKKVTKQQAMASALTGAAKKTGFGFMKPIREIEEFQLHAPIIRVKKGYTSSCLGKDTVELDMPFHVVFQAGDKQKKKGFVKARKIHDGCTMTPSMEAAAAKGKKYKIHPMEAQIILGGKKVRKGVTMWEMPTNYLNIGGGAGITGTANGIGVGAGNFRFWPVGELFAEQNIARKIGISEFYTTEFLRFSYIPESSAGTFNTNFENSFAGSNMTYDGSWFMMQADFGILKRWFLGPFFLGLGADLAVSIYIGMTDPAGGLASASDYTPMVLGVGALGQLDLGFQLTPRFLLALRLGYRVEYGLPFLIKDGENYGGSYTEMGVGHGPNGALNLIYSF
ncbi:MAG: hypothetical protein ISR64_08595 [Deltaproteobacteria bacterium]|nr:hypothetical protein [Deltaproteobacteria bacterium]